MAGTRTGSVPCDHEGVFGGPRSGPPSAPARGFSLATSEGGSQRMVVSSEQELGRDMCEMYFFFFFASCEPLN